MALNSEFITEYGNYKVYYILPRGIYLVVDSVNNNNIMSHYTDRQLAINLAIGCHDTDQKLLAEQMEKILRD